MTFFACPEGGRFFIVDRRPEGKLLAFRVPREAEFLWELSGFVARFEAPSAVGLNSDSTVPRSDGEILVDGRPHANQHPRGGRAAAQVDKV